MISRALIILWCLTLAACSPGWRSVHTQQPRPQAPALMLSPASLGRTLALQQQWRFTRKDGQDTLDALLEIDHDELRLAVLKAGQLLLRLRWDGKQLQQWRAEQLPASLQGERILSDLQLTLWPLDVINAALPQGWRAAEHQGTRQLRHNDELITTIRYPSTDQVAIQQHHAGFSLSITSTPPGAH